MSSPKQRNRRWAEVLESGACVARRVELSCPSGGRQMRDLAHHRAPLKHECANCVAY